jgi:hypothetical protein
VNAHARKLKMRAYLLARRGAVELIELRKVFGVSEKTLKADLRDIQDSGVLLIRELVDKRATVQVSSHHAFNETSLSQWEMWSAVAATMRMKHHPPTFRGAHGVHKKVTDAMPYRERVQAERMHQLMTCLHHGGIKVYREDKDAIYDVLMQATINRWMVRFVYETASGVVKRGFLAPYCFVEYNQGFYVHGRLVKRPEDGQTPDVTPGMPQTWPYERFREVEPLRGHPVRVPKSFRAEDCADSFGLCTGPRAQRCVIECEPSIAPYIRERTWHPTQTLSAPDENGRVRLSFESRALPDVARWVSTWQGAAVPLEPPELVTRVYRALTEGATRMRERLGGETLDTLVAGATRPKPRRKKAKRAAGEIEDALDTSAVVDESMSEPPATVVATARVS